jgi:hypothetical protein
VSIHHYIIKTIYHYDEVFVSAQKKETGELSILLREFGLPSHLSSWMEYYAFHLAHPKMSNVEISYRFAVTKSTIQRALTFMACPIE